MSPKSFRCRQGARAPGHQGTRDMMYTYGPQAWPSSQWPRDRVCLFSTTSRSCLPRHCESETRITRIIRIDPPLSGVPQCHCYRSSAQVATVTQVQYLHTYSGKLTLYCVCKTQGLLLLLLLLHCWPGLPGKGLLPPSDPADPVGSIPVSMPMTT